MWWVIWIGTHRCAVRFVSPCRRSSLSSFAGPGCLWQVVEEIVLATSGLARVASLFAQPDGRVNARESCRTLLGVCCADWWNSVIFGTFGVQRGVRGTFVHSSYNPFHLELGQYAKAENRRTKCTYFDTLEC